MTGKTYAHFCHYTITVTASKPEKNFTHTHTHTHLMALFQDYPGEPVPERQNQSGFYWSKRR